MNLQEIWSGTDYAWFEWKGRNEPFREKAPRVKAIRVYKKQEFGKDRASGFVEVMMCDDDGTPKTYSNGEQIIKEVRARDIAMRWDEYADERDYRQTQAEKIERERQAVIEAEARKKSEFIDAVITKYGLPRDAISSITHATIYLNRHVLERELGFGETPSS